MVTTSEMHRLLDEYVAALTAAGSSIEAYLRRNPHSEDYVRASLTEAGHVDLEEAVGFLTWRRFTPRSGTRNDAGYDLFYPVMKPLPVEEAISFQRKSYDLVKGDHFPPSWPGAETFLPLTFADGSEFVSVDCGTGEDAGAVWYVDPWSESVRMFDSLSEGILAATYCVEAGLWQCDKLRIKCDRRYGIAAQDLTNPPWLD